MSEANWTRKQYDGLRRMLAKGFPIAEIAAHLGKSVQDCQSRLPSPREKRAWSDWQRRLLIEKVKVWSVEKLASYLGLPPDEVEKKIAELKLKS